MTETGKESVYARKNDCYRTLLSELSPQDVPSAVMHTLCTLCGRGCRLAVGSSSRNARFILEQTQLLTYFDAVADGTVVARSKLAPDIFLFAASLLHLPPEKCAFVKDAPAGILAARTADMKVIALGNRSDFSDVSPDYCIQTVADILRIRF